jgi:hypothetical protein
LTKGFLIIDDTTLDKPDSRAIELVTRHWSGKHHRVVLGINRISMLWTEGDAHLPCDFRIDDKAHDGVTKNDHVQAMVKGAAERGCHPQLVGFDSWDASLENVKLVRSLNWQWLTQLKANRLVDPDGSGNRPIRAVLILRHGAIVHLKGYGFIKVFKMAPPDGGIAYWATSDLGMRIAQCAEDALYLGASKRIIAVSSSAAASSEPGTAPQLLRGITSAWLSVPSSVWKVTACVQARRGLRPKQPLFVRRYGPTWPNHSIPRSQLRNF